MPWRESYNSLLLCAGPVYQGMAQELQVRAERRNQRTKGFRKTEAQKPCYLYMNHLE